MRAQFRVLGDLLLENAKDRILEMKKSLLLEQAKIQANLKKKCQERVNRMHDDFVERSNQLINTKSSELLLEFKEKFIKLKNDLVRKLKQNVQERMEEQISEKFDEYTAFMVEEIQLFIQEHDLSGPMHLILNSNDRKAFEGNLESQIHHINEEITIVETVHESKGGFILFHNESGINLDMRFSTILDTTDEFLENTFANTFDSINFNEVEMKLANYIKHERTEIEKYLKHQENE